MDEEIEKRVYEFVLSYCRDIFFMCNFLFFAFVLSLQVYAQYWMRLLLQRLNSCGKVGQWHVDRTIEKDILSMHHVSFELSFYEE